MGKCYFFFLRRKAIPAPIPTATPARPTGRSIRHTLPVEAGSVGSAAGFAVGSGVAAGAFLAFVSSLDNVPVSLFLTSANTDMLPIRLWGMMETALDVRLAAASGVLVAAAFVLLLVMERAVGLAKRMSG